VGCRLEIDDGGFCAVSPTNSPAQPQNASPLPEKEAHFCICRCSSLEALAGFVPVPFPISRGFLICRAERSNSRLGPACRFWLCQTRGRCVLLICRVFPPRIPRFVSFSTSSCHVLGHEMQVPISWQVDTGRTERQISIQSRPP